METPKRKEFITTENNEALSVYFQTQELDFLSLGIVTTSLHRIINKVAITGFDGRSEDQRFFAKQSGPFGDWLEPYAVSMAITELRSGSFFATGRPLISRDLRIGIAGSLIASAIWCIGEGVSRRLIVHAPDPMPPPYQVDVGPNVRSMVDRLSERGHPWELQLRDAQKGTELIIRSQ